MVRSKAIHSALNRLTIFLEYANNRSDLKSGLTGFRRYGCLNSDISKYSHLKEKCLFFMYKSKVANVMTLTDRHTIQAHDCPIS